MAKLGAYYGLCPIIDHRSLLGISPDEESGIVIVTLGKNIAIKYKLLDQKQMHSWRTKEKFTSPIIYDKEQEKYVAAFNQRYLHMWRKNDDFLDKLKKIKVKQPIHTIFSCDNKSFVVFTNGDVTLLSDVIKYEKSLTLSDVINPKSDYITEVLTVTHNSDIYIGLLVKSEGNDFFYWTQFREGDEKQKFNKFLVSRPDFELTGYLLHAHKHSVSFMSLWSDGRIFSLSLDETEHPEPFGELLTAVEALSCTSYVSMASLDENYIALYGCNSNEEGALLLIYNIQFKVIQARQPFKLFTKGAKLSTIDTNLFLAVGQNLAVVPFYLHAEQLAALVGSHKVIEQDDDVSIVHSLKQVSWSEETPRAKKAKIPPELKALIADFLSQGLPEHLIISELTPKLIEDKNTGLICECLNYFCDIPDACLSKLLKYALNIEPKALKTPKEQQRRNLLDLILAKVFNDALILPHLHRDLSVDEAVDLVKYICFLLENNELLLPGLNAVQSERKLISWGSIIIDSNYQKFILARSDNIGEVLGQFKSIIDGELDCLKDLKKMLPVVAEAKKGRSIYKLIANDVHYSVEKLTLY